MDNGLVETREAQLTWLQKSWEDEKISNEKLKA